MPHEQSIGPKVECHKYVSHPEPQYAPNTSDHTPVSAWFSVEVRKAGINKAGLASSFSKMRSRGSSVKSRSMVITDLQYEPEITHIVPLYLDEDEPDKAAALGQIKAAQLYISMYHTSLKQRQKTKSQLWNDVAVKWSDTIKLDTQAAIEDVSTLKVPCLCSLHQTLRLTVTRLGVSRELAKMGFLEPRPRPPAAAPFYQTICLFFSFFFSEGGCGFGGSS